MELVRLAARTKGPVGQAATRQQQEEQRRALPHFASGKKTTTQTNVDGELPRGNDSFRTSDGWQPSLRGEARRRLVMSSGLASLYGMSFQIYRVGSLPRFAMRKGTWHGEESGKPSPCPHPGGRARSRGDGFLVALHVAMLQSMETSLRQGGGSSGS